MQIYSDLLSWAVAKRIEKVVEDMVTGRNARANLNKAFIETFGVIKQWKSEVAKKINQKRHKNAEDVKKGHQHGADGADGETIDFENDKESRKMEADLMHSKDWGHL
jgi:CRISPR/Cas system-associated protein Cas10 (large subunit of type III CRISPR-Cas system)